MNFYQKLKYLPEDIESTKLLPILVLTHLWLLQQTSKTFEFQGEQLKVSQEISNLEKEIKKLLENPRLKVPKMKLLPLLTADYPEIAEFLQIQRNFDLQVAATFFENGLLPWWWEVDPLLLTLLKDLVFKRAIDPQKWIEISDVLLEKNRTSESILALEEALWQSTGETTEIETDLRNKINNIKTKKDSLVNTYHDILSRLDALEQGSYKDHPKIIKEIYKILKTSKLRKKTKWLLWERVLGKINDPIEFERQREEILAELSLSGLESFEIPHFITECLGADASQKKSLNENASILEEIQEFLITSSKETSWKETEFLVGTIGLINAKEGNLERALSLVEKYKSTNTAISNFKLAAILLEVGEKEEALLLFEKAWDQFRAKLKETSGKQGMPGQNLSTLINPYLETIALMTNSSGATDKFLEIISTQPNYATILALMPNELFAKVFSGKLDRVLDLVDAEGSVFTNSVLLENYFEKIEIGAREVDERKSAELSESALKLYSKSVETNQVHEFVIRFLPGLLSNVDNSWEWVELLCKKCTGIKSDHPQTEGAYERILIKICGVKALAIKKDFDLGKKMFAELLEQIWELGDKHQETKLLLGIMRAITNLLYILPHFGDVFWGFEVIEAVNKRSKEFINREVETSAESRKFGPDEKVNTYLEQFIIQISIATSTIALGLSDTQTALTIIEDNLQYLLNYLKTSQGSSKDLLYDAISQMVLLISNIGDPNGLLIIENLEEETQRYYEEKLKGKEDSRIFYIAQTCLECVLALLAQGKEGARGKLEELLEKTKKRSGTVNLAELIREIIKKIERLTHEDRLWLVGLILQIIRNYSYAYWPAIVKKLIMTLAEENATYLRNLEIWKNQEERSIIDRVVSFGI